MSEPNCCRDYVEYRQKIAGFIRLGFYGAGRYSAYERKPFTWCPWCGTRLEIKKGDWLPMEVVDRIKRDRPR